MLNRASFMAASTASVPEFDRNTRAGSPPNGASAARRSATSALRRRGAETRALLRLGARRQTPVAAPPEPDTFWPEVRRLPRRQAQSVAKLYGGVKANEIVDRVLQMHGGMGYTRELPVERWYRELRLLRIYEGTDEIQRRTISRNLLRGHADVKGHLG